MRSFAGDSAVFYGGRVAVFASSCGNQPPMNTVTCTTIADRAVTPSYKISNTLALQLPFVLQAHTPRELDVIDEAVLVGIVLRHQLRKKLFTQYHLEVSLHRLSELCCSDFAKSCESPEAVQLSSQLLRHSTG